MTSKTFILDHGQKCVGCIPVHMVLSLSNFTLCQLAVRVNSNLNAVALTELVKSEVGGRLPSARGMRFVANNVTTKANDSVFESASKDFQTIHSACDEFMEKNPVSHTSAVNYPGNYFTSFAIVFRDNARRAHRSSMF